MYNHGGETNNPSDDIVASSSRQSSSLCQAPKRPRISSAVCMSNGSPSLGATADLTDNDDFNISATINAYKEPSDEAILKWQEIQLAHSIVDNTVNRVVESYLLLFDEAEDSQNPGLEESAILMAINEHGLQNNDENDAANEPAVAVAAEPQQRASPLEPPSNDQVQRHHCAILTSAAAAYLDNAIECLTSDEDSTDDEDVVLNESISPGSSNITDSAGEIPSNSEHFDFMEAAVAVAIQKKGLTPHSMQMSPNR